MKDHGEAGCALIFVVALVAGVVYVLFIAPWLLIVVPVVLILLLIALVVLADVTSDDVLITAEELGGFTGWRVSLMNRLRVAFNKQPLLEVPKNRVTYEERQLVKKAANLAAGVGTALRTNPAAVTDQQQILLEANSVPANMAKALWRLERLRQLSRALNTTTQEGQRNRTEMDNLEQQILAEMQRGLDTLASVPVNLMKVEVAQSGRPVDRLLAELNDTNQHLNDISSTYDELHMKQGQ